MRLTIVPLSLTFVIAACGGMEDDPSTLLAENTESIQVGDEVPAESGSNLIATLSLDNGNTLDFYEPSPGAVMISEVGRLPNPPVSTKYSLHSMSAVEIYRALAPGQTVPAALVAAQDRVDGRVALEDATGAETSVEPFANHGDVAVDNDANQADGAKDDEASSHPEAPGPCGSFRRIICKAHGRLYPWKRCVEYRPQVTFRHNAAKQAWGVVCVDRGSGSWSFVRQDARGRRVKFKPLRRVGEYYFEQWPLQSSPFKLESKVTGNGLFHHFVGVSY